MGLSEQIDAIIAKRQARLPDIKQKLKDLEEMEQAVRELELLRREMLDESGQVIKESRFEPLLQKNPDMVWGLQSLSFHEVYTSIDRASRALMEYEKRCTRDTVNISVVGVAGSGKSALLQSISGLSNKVIPSFSSTDCTGAPSVILNTPGSAMDVKLTFKSRDEMRDMAQNYLNEMIADENARPVLHSMEEIRTLSLEKIDKAIPQGSSKRTMLSFLKKMVVHYTEWASLAGMKPMEHLTDENEIITFVSQHNGKVSGTPERENYYKYLAVDTCEISCSFLSGSEQDSLGKICLIDTVGLGDLTVGLLDSMLKTVNERSDAVIFTHQPLSAREAYVISDSMREGYDIINENCGDRALDKWLYYLINLNRNNPESPEACKRTLEELSSGKYRGCENAKIIDALDRESVIHDFLIPMLENVAANLDEIDETFRRPAQEALSRAFSAGKGLFENARKVLQSDMRSNANLAPQISRLADKSFDDLKAEIYTFMMQWHARRETPCPVLHESAAEIFERMTQTFRDDFYLPPVSEITRRLNRGTHPSALYRELANSVRNMISKDFLDVDLKLSDEVKSMKNRLAVILYDTCGLNTICPLPKGKSDDQWLDEFCDTILTDETVYPNLRLAFDTIRHFEFSVRGFLTYEVRRCLDGIDPAWINIPPVIQGSGADTGDTAKNIFHSLHWMLCDIESIIETKMKELLIKPNMAIFAEVADFYDRIVYAEGAESEWKYFFANYSIELWGEQLRKQAQAVVLCQEWLAAVEQFHHTIMLLLGSD